MDEQEATPSTVRLGVSTVTLDETAHVEAHPPFFATLRYAVDKPQSTQIELA